MTLAAPGRIPPGLRDHVDQSRENEGDLSRGVAKNSYSFTTSICLLGTSPGKPVDRHVYPVVLLAFRDEIILKTISIWLIVTRLATTSINTFQTRVCETEVIARGTTSPRALTVYLGALPPLTGRPTKIRYSGGAPNLTVTWLEQSCVPASHTL